METTPKKGSVFVLICLLIITAVTIISVVVINGKDQKVITLEEPEPIACGGPNLNCQAWVNQEYCGYDYPKCGHCVTNPLWIGDGFCDEHLNNPECGNDGGDCADLMSMPGFTKTPSDHLERITKATEESTCVFPPDVLPSWLGNGICDPALNNALCDWDGNDCDSHPSFSPYF